MRKWFSRNEAGFLADFSLKVSNIEVLSFENEMGDE